MVSRSLMMDLAAKYWECWRGSIQPTSNLRYHKTVTIITLKRGSWKNSHQRLLPKKKAQQNSKIVVLLFITTNLSFCQQKTQPTLHILGKILQLLNLNQGYLRDGFLYFSPPKRGNSFTFLSLPRSVWDKCKVSLPRAWRSNSPGKLPASVVNEW